MRKSLLAGLVLAANLALSCSEKQTDTGPPPPPPKTEVIKTPKGDEETKTFVPD